MKKLQNRIRGEDPRQTKLLAKWLVEIEEDKFCSEMFL